MEVKAPTWDAEIDRFTMPSVLQSMQFVRALGPFRLPWSWGGGYPKRLTLPEPQEHWPVDGLKLIRGCPSLETFWSLHSTQATAVPPFGPYLRSLPLPHSHTLVKSFNFTPCVAK